MTYRHTLLLALFTVLTACQGECSCGTVDGDDGSGGSGASTSTATGTPAVTSSSSGAGTGGGGGDTGSGGGDATTTTGPGGGGSGGGGQGGGSGGAGTGGAGGGPEAARECEIAEDCQLLNDCCACDAIPASETPEECLAQCIQPSCDAQLRPKDAEVACVAGRCVAGFECDWSLTECDAAPPACEEGFTSSVIDGCYGPCVLATECLSVGSCDQCDGGLACVQRVDFGTSTHCVSDGGACDPDDCACLGPSVCDQGDACFDIEDVVTCECTNC